MARVFLENCQRTVRWKLKFEVFVAFTILLNYDGMVFDFSGGTCIVYFQHEDENGHAQNVSTHLSDDTVL
jgi:hypothetical protein